MSYQSETYRAATALADHDFVQVRQRRVRSLAPTHAPASEYAGPVADYHHRCFLVTAR